MRAPSTTVIRENPGSRHAAGVGRTLQLVGPHVVQHLDGALQAVI
jgi:hypothetical protein